MTAWPWKRLSPSQSHTLVSVALESHLFPSPSPLPSCAHPSAPRCTSSLRHRRIRPRSISSTLDGACLQRPEHHRSSPWEISSYLRRRRMSQARSSHGSGHQQPSRQHLAAAFVLLLQPTQQSSHEAAMWPSSLAVGDARVQRTSLRDFKANSSEEGLLVQRAYENLKYGEKRTLCDQVHSLRCIRCHS
ncbi:hypothetical protein ZWY2020_028199 [Hordeum vulgare]|nr:hypothetical protein ZWY2020_028199 [Hordeum vulgare]